MNMKQTKNLEFHRAFISPNKCIYLRYSKHLTSLISFGTYKIFFWIIYSVAVTSEYLLLDTYKDEQAYIAAVVLLKTILEKITKTSETTISQYIYI